MSLGLTPFQCILKLLNLNEMMLSVNKALLQQSVAYNLSIMAPLKKLWWKGTAKQFKQKQNQIKKKRDHCSGALPKKFIALTAVNDSL